jgi:Helix-turn-helix domain
MPKYSDVEWPGRIGPQDEVTLGEAAEILGLSPSRVRQLVETDELAARINYSVIRISLADIQLYRLHTGV